MKDGFIRVASATPKTRITDIGYNSDQIIRLIKDASSEDCSLIVFPELSITGYTCGDLFHQDTFTDAAYDALLKIVDETKDLNIAAVVGLPYRFEGKLYNVGAVISKGNILGLVPKRFIPNYSEFYELRHFTPFEGIAETSDGILFGNIIFENETYKDFTFAVEICEDLWVPNPPSIGYATNGAMIICNLSASDEVIGKSEYRRKLVSMNSARTLGAYIYSDCGFGESTQDMVFAGHNIIAENGSVLAESKAFSSGLTITDTDIKKLSYERRRMNSFSACPSIKTAYFSLDVTETVLDRTFSRTPFVPSDKKALDSRCEEILTMQAVGLMTRLRHIGCKTAALGLSGGLDSTLALIVTVHAFDMLGLGRNGIHTITMPCFGTTDRTYSNACTLAEVYGTTLTEIDIRSSVMQHCRY